MCGIVARVARNAFHETFDSDFAVKVSTRRLISYAGTMLILGVHGSLFEVCNAFPLHPHAWHDAAAVLLEDGEIIQAIEEERLTRIKHCNRFPIRAIKHCLAQRGVTLDDVESIVYTSDEGDVRYCLGQYPLDAAMQDPRTRLGSLFRDHFGAEVGNRLSFVPHHYCHVTSAHAMSGFRDCLAISLDGVGDRLSGLVCSVRGGELETLRSLSVPESLGLFYLCVIRYLGYDLFDEYKVMGLAPYGDPAVYREALQTAYKLLPEGRWSICEDRLVEALNAYPARRKGAPFTEQDQDLAAALQETLETLAFHLIGHFRETTGHRNLALAGGVSLNCTMTGKLLESGLFDGVFVQPASHDGGCAVGAALHEWSRLNPIHLLNSRVEHVYWGSEVGPEDAILTELRRWERLFRIERMDDVIASTAKLLAGDAVVGWVQGRSEYGPRALGNRSILADPRPAANKDRINQMIKKREGYRPFAPSVLEEELHSIFEVSDHADVLRFMGFTAQVRPELRATLGAITHVDGSARLQTVSRKTNPKYWELIEAFRQETGIPLLLNTSFNNNAEPIVDSVRDAVVCYLTTGLDLLIVDNFLITRRDDVSEEAFLAFSACLPTHHFVREVFENDADERWITAVEIVSSYDERRCQKISRRMREFLFSDAPAALPDDMSPDDRKTFVIELRELWSGRWIRLNDPSEERIGRL